MGKTLNFDLFMQEQEQKTIDIQVFGDTYSVPMEIPAIVPLMMARAEESMNPRETTRMVMRAADSMFGSENVDKMCAKGLTAKNLTALVEKVFAEINGTAEEDEDAEELDDESGMKQTRGRPRKK